MKRTLFRAASALLPALAFISNLAAEPADVIARVGDAEIKAADLRPYLADLSAEQQAALAKDPARLNQFLRTLIVERLLLKQALAAKWEQQPAVVAQLEQLRQNAIAQGYLAAKAAVPADYPSAAEVQAAYDANRDALVVPRQLRLAQIFIAAPKDAKEPEKLATVRKALASNPEKFAELARTSSDEAKSAAQGGEIGWLRVNEIQPDVRDAAAALAKGAISAPIRTDDGWHILRLIDVREAAPAPFADVRDALAQRLRAERAQQISRDYVENLLKENPVAINEIAVSQLVKGADSGTSPQDKGTKR